MGPRAIWRALRNFFWVVRHNPGWALSALVFSPFALLKHLFGVLSLFIIAGLVLSLSAKLALWYFAIPRDTLIYNATYAIVGMAVVFITLRGFIAPLVLHYGYAQGGDTHGSARFASQAEKRPLIRDTGLLLGRDPKSDRLLRYAGPAHLLTIAPTRTGKGAGTVITNLLDYPGPVVCIDPKGENARVTARQRGRFGSVHVLDPFGVTGMASAAFNPLDRIDPNGLDFADDCMTLADALVHDNAPAEAESHWNEEAKALIAGLILHIAAAEPPATRNLTTLRDYLTLDPQGFTALLDRMQAQGGLIARTANRQRGKAEREAAGVLSTAQRHTHFLDSPRMSAVLGRSDFSFADLKAGTASIYLALPPDRLGAYSRWLRLLVAQALTDLARAPGQPAWPILLLLDEFAALGQLEPVERAMGLMAGYGVQLWPILQDIHQLRALYGQRAGTFLSNAGVLQIFGVNDQQSAQLVSDLLGQETLVFETMSRALDAQESGLSFGVQHVGRSLLTPDEVRTIPASRQLLFLAGQHPVIADKLAYYADREFAGKFDRA
ncbi:conjugal transfer protein TraG (plasmid) [Rhizorhabdus wittichii DC-6]|nr:conjugal transfer protein TraG [Rhizorhabdus wittichii DC-6]